MWRWLFFMILFCVGSFLYIYFYWVPACSLWETMPLCFVLSVLALGLLQRDVKRSVAGLLGKCSFVYRCESHGVCWVRFHCAPV